MRLGKIKPTATIVAQFAAGVEVEAIQHDGRIFMPVVSMGEFGTDEEPAKPTPTPARKPEPTDAPEPAAEATTSKKYTEDELMDMETKDLLKMCKEMNIDPDATEGKNTNKKLRKLILEAQKGGAAQEKPAKPAPAEETTADDETVSAIAEILNDFDEGKKNKKKTINAILDLYEDTTEDDKEVVTKHVEEFEDDADADAEKIAKKLAAALSGDEEEVVADEKPSKSKKGGKEKLVSPEDLEVGDRVSVWWDDDNQEWYDGEVKSISKKGKVVIAYDDGTEDAIDPEVHTKIKLLSK